MPTRLWELGAGCLLFFGLESSNRSFVVLGSFPSLLVFSAAIAVLFFPLHFAVPATISIVVLTAVLIAALRPETIAYEILCHPLVNYIGLISYSLYLWHWSVLSLSGWTVGIYLWTVPFQVALMLLIAAASFRYVEMPLRRAEWSQLRWQSIAYGLAASLSAAAVVFIVGKPLKGGLEQIGNYIYPPAYAKPGIFQHNLYCHLPRRSDTAFDDCLKAAASGNRNIYIIGDSHASNHYPGISEAIKNITDLSVRVLIDWGFINSLSGKENCGILVPCIQDSFRKHLSFLRENLKRGDIVVFSWARDRIVAKGKLPRQINIESIKVLEGKLNIIKQIVVGNGASLILVDDIPKPCDDNIVFEMDIIRHGRLESCSKNTSDSKEDRKGLTDLYHSLLGPNVYYFDPHDFLCSAGKCGLTIVKSGSLIYGDASPHFTHSQAILIAEPWREFLRRILADTAYDK